MDTNYFGFKRNPFSQSSDSKFFYQSVSHRGAFDSLYAGFSKGEPLFLLTGDAGTGKTSLLRKLGARFGSNARVIFLQYSGRRGLKYLLEPISTELGLRVKNKNGHAVRRLLNRFFKGYRGKKAVIVIIDDVHLIEDDVFVEFLKLFSQWSNSAGRIKVVLAGLTALETKYQRASSRAGGKIVSRYFRLSRLETNEVKDYINRRLRSVGYSGKSLFPDETIERVVDCTHGIPRLINTICGSALYVAGIEKQPVVTPDLIKEAKNHCLLEKNPGSKVGDKETELPPVDREGGEETFSYADFEKVNSDNSTIRVDTDKNYSAESGLAPLSLEELTPVTFVSHPRSDDRVKANRWFSLLGGKKKPVMLAAIALSLTAITLVVGFTVIPGGDIVSDIEPNSFQSYSSPMSASTEVTELAALGRQGMNGYAKQAQPLSETATNEKRAASKRSSTSNAASHQALGDTKSSPNRPLKNHAEGLENRIAKLREKANQQMRDRLLTLPEDDNALQTYRKILALSPGDAKAQRGIEEIRQKYTNWARRRAEAKDWERSRRYYSRALSIVPVDMEVLREYRKLIKIQRRYFHENEDPWAVNIRADLPDHGRINDAKQ